MIWITRNFPKKDIAEPGELLSIYDFGQLDDVKNPECEPWMETIIACDIQRDLSPLLNLMQSRTLPAAVVPYLRDLFERRGQIKGVRAHKDRTPLYELSATDINLVIACMGVKDWVLHGATVEEAIGLEAKESGINETTLGYAYNQQRGYSMRRRKARRKNMPA